MCAKSKTGRSKLPLKIPKTADFSVNRRFFLGTADGIRTHDLQSRSLALYPAELQPHVKELALAGRICYNSGGKRYYSKNPCQSKGLFFCLFHSTKGVLSCKRFDWGKAVWSPPSPPWAVCRFSAATRTMPSVSCAPHTRAAFAFLIPPTPIPTARRRSVLRCTMYAATLSCPQKPGRIPKTAFSGMWRTVCA